MCKKLTGLAVYFVIFHIVCRHTMCYNVVQKKKRGL